MAVNFPRGISKAKSNAPDLSDLWPTPPAPGPIPIPYPNKTPFADVPATKVIDALLFEPSEFEVVGTAAPTDLWLV